MKRNIFIDALKIMRKLSKTIKMKTIGDKLIISAYKEEGDHLIYEMPTFREVGMVVDLISYIAQLELTPNAPIKLPNDFAQIDDQEFPDVPESSRSSKIRIMTWSAHELYDALNYLIRALSPISGKPHIDGIYIDKYNMVTTNGSRLHEYYKPNSIGDILISRKTALLMKSLLHLDDVVLTKIDDILQICSGPWTLYTNIIDNKYPNYKHLLLTQKQPYSILVDRILLNKALTKILKKKSNCIRVDTNLGKYLTLDGYGPDTDIIVETVIVPLLDCSDVYPPSEEFFFLINPNFLKDAVISTGEKIKLSFIDRWTTIQVDIVGQNKTALVMPLRSSVNLNSDRT